MAVVRRRNARCESLESRLLLSADHLEVLPPYLGATAQPVAAEVAAADVSFDEPSDFPPILNSLPEAEAKIFLDFDGNLEPSWGGNVNVLTPAFDIDGNPEQYSPEEQRRIHEAWARVAEDFAPFNVNVTTEDPADANTMLRQSISVSQRTRTFYFRQQFNVDDASAVSDLCLQLLRDAGAALYLNGIEVVRDNLPADAKFDDFASSTASGDEESTLQSFSIDASLLVDGENVLAVEVHQASDTSSDVSFDLSLEGSISGDSESLVELGSVWKYLDDGSDQGERWQATAFDDSDWPMARAEFGYGDSDEASALQVRPDGQGQTRTFYFRHEFDISDPASLSALTIGLLRDDGAAVYLNGEEVVRDNLADNAEFDDFALSTASNADETTFYESVVSADLLREGRNVLAVEVHQVSDTSSDVSFDLEMRGIDLTGDEQPLVSAGSDWRYLDDGTDQGVAWREFDYDDLPWLVGTSQFGYGDAPGTVHVAIGTEDWFEDSAGGVAFVNSFDLGGRAVVYAFTNGFGPSGKNIAEVTSHEAGHAFGLRHQSVYDPDTGERIQEYNPGVGDWAPIMGVGYSDPLTTWHDGQVGSAGTTQDDMAVLARNANGFGYRADDHGNRANSASPLLLESSTYIEVTGIVERNSDRDVFAFSLEEGQGGISIVAEGAPLGANLDAVLEIYDQAGDIVAMDDPTDSYNASIDAELAPGDYTVLIRSNGEYGRVGQYTLTGEVDEPLTAVALESIGPLSPNASASDSQNAIINFAGDLDSFSVVAQQGDLLSAVVTPNDPTATLTVAALGIADPIVGERGGSVTLPLTSIAEDGTYQLDVMGDVNTAYTIRVGLNLEFEAEDTSVPSTQTLGNPLSVGLERQTVIGQSELSVETTSLVQRNSLWRYLDDGSNQGEQWRAADFDDSEWESGRGEFGYGDNDERTEVEEDGLDGTRIRTFYFRQQFEITDLGMANELLLELKYDDGTAVYLNGQEVVRDNLAPGAGYRDFAPSTVSNEDDYRQYQLDAELLRAGTNVLAIEVHQASDTSSDVSMDARLDLTQQRPAIDAFTFDVTEADAQQNQRILLQGRGANFREQVVEILAADGQTVLATSEPSDSNTFDLSVNWPAPSAGTYIARVTSSTVGQYVLSIGSDLSVATPGDTNFDGMVDFADFLVLSGAFGLEGDWRAGDFDGDGLVGFSDFLVLSRNFGK